MREALDGVSKARAALPGQLVKVQTELGDVYIPELEASATDPVSLTPNQHVKNTGIEFFKIKYPDLLGAAQWTVLRNNRSVKVDMLHQGWLDAYHRREHVILPGDSLKCRFEELIGYDINGTEIERRLSIVEVLDIVSPPVQQPLNLRS